MAFDRYQAFRCLDAVAEAGSLAAAARTLGLAEEALARVLAALEAYHGRPLFERSTRGLRLNADGEQLRLRAVSLLQRLQAAERSAAGVHQDSDALLVIAAPPGLGRILLLPLLLEQLAARPAARMALRLLERPVNLHEEGVDVALQAGPLPDSSNIALPLGSTARLLVAAPGYLAAHGTPHTPDALSRHRVVATAGDTASGIWRLDQDDLAPGLALNAQLTVNDAAAAIDSARHGLGIAAALQVEVDADLASGRLVAVLPQLAAPALPLFLIYRQGHRAAGRLRAFLDTALPRLRATPGLSAP